MFHPYRSTYVGHATTIKMNSYAPASVGFAFEIVDGGTIGGDVGHEGDMLLDESFGGILVFAVILVAHNRLFLLHP